MSNDKKLKDSVVKDYSTGQRFEYAAAIDRGLSNFEKDLIEKYVKIKNACILVLGCGGGRESFALRKKGFKVFGLDINNKLISSAVEKSRELNLNVEFVVGDMCSLPYKNNFFDYILILEQSLGHVPRELNRIKVLEECYRVIKEGGNLIFSTYYRYSNVKRALYLTFLDGLRFINNCLFSPFTALEYSDWKIKNKGYVNMPSQRRTMSEIDKTKFNLVEILIEPGRRNSFFVCGKTKLEEKLDHEQ